MKLGNLIPLEEINFRNQKEFDDYAKKHTLRSTTKVTIAGKDTTAGQATQSSQSVSGANVKSITDIKLNKQADVSMVSKSILPNLRLDDGSGHPDSEAVELKKRLEKGDGGTYTRTSQHGGRIVFKDGTVFQVFRPRDAQKTGATKIYASKNNY